MSCVCHDLDRLADLLAERIVARLMAVRYADMAPPLMEIRCTTCGARPPAEGRKTCARCLSVRRADYAMKVAK